MLGKRTGCCTVSAAYKQGNSFDVKHSVRPLTSYDLFTKHALKQNLTQVAEASISRTQLLYGARDQCAHTGVGFVGSRHNKGSNEFKWKQRHSQFSVSGLSEQTIPLRRHMCAWRKDSSLPVTKSSPDQTALPRTKDKTPPLANTTGQQQYWHVTLSPRKEIYALEPLVAQVGRTPPHWPNTRDWSAMPVG